MTVTLPAPDGTTATGDARDLDARELHQLLAGDAGLRLLDVRTPGEFTAGHIPGAVNIPLDQLADRARDLAHTDAGPLVLVCQGGGRATTARDLLTAAGCSDLLVLTGGMTAWNGTGGKSERDAAGRWTLERQVRLAAGALVATGIAASTAWAPAKYLSGAVGAGLILAAVTDTCAMGRVLSRLPYNRGRAGDLDKALHQLTH